MWKDNKEKLKSSLIISSYNWPEALSLVLKSVSLQRIRPNEVLIADDGSTQETRELIEKFDNSSNFNIKHIWHKDDGFRKAIILNKAIAEASGDYIIQVDGDCILHKNFIEDHLRFAENNTYLYGSRVNIQQSYLNKLFEKRQIAFPFYSRGITKRTRNLHMPFLSSFYKPSSCFSSKYRGCNTSYFKKDAIIVNGYNEDIKGWGREDSEFAIRLNNNGVKGKRIRYAGIVYHIFHHEKSKNYLDKNNSIQEATVTNKTTWCNAGIDKYL